MLLAKKQQDTKTNAMAGAMNRLIEDEIMVALKRTKIRRDSPERPGFCGGRL